MKRYSRNKRNIVQQIDYVYDTDGYLIGRNLIGYKYGFMKFNIYSSSLKYSEDKRIIEENFIKEYYINNKLIKEKELLTYYYNNNNMLIQIDRNGEKELEYKYNERGDLIEATHNVGYSLVPNDGLAEYIKKNEKFSLYQYEYEENKKTRFLLREKDYEKVDGYFYENNRIVKILKYHSILGISNEGSLFYDNNNNLIKTIFYSKDPNLNDYKIIEYKYDNKNRLIERLLYFRTENINKNKLKEIEEYFYEDSNYVYYPYLLPPKIKNDATCNYERFLDKDMF